MTPAVDMVVPVHDPRRPIERAVGSALRAAEPGAVRVLVVVHNTEREPIEARLRSLQAERVEMLELHDGVRSPAGPFNAGLAAASAPYISVMGSDDELQVGAISSWLQRARRLHADAVLARVRYAGGRAVPTPPTRPFTRPLLDPVKDRLSYRSAPLGILSREHFGTLRFAERLAVGEDVPYVTRLWFSGGRITYDRRGPAYLIHTDLEERTTTTPRPVVDELAYVRVVLDDPWYEDLSDSAQASIAVKLLRIHLFGAVLNRQDRDQWTRRDREALAVVAQRILTASPGAERVLSRRDRDLLDAALDPSSPASVLVRAAVMRRRFGHPASLLPRDLRYALRGEAPLRMAAATALQLL